MHKLTEEGVEFFLVQAWLLWNQHNLIVYGGTLQEPGRLNARAGSFLQEFQEAQTQLTLPVLHGHSHRHGSHLKDKYTSSILMRQFLRTC